MYIQIYIYIYIHCCVETMYAFTAAVALIATVAHESIKLGSQTKHDHDHNSLLDGHFLESKNSILNNNLRNVPNGKKGLTPASLKAM